MKDEEKVSPRACRVCGHTLAPYLRICDKCGSIQRPIFGDGTPVASEKLARCVRCGKPIPEGEEYCYECTRVLRASRSKKDKGSRVIKFLIVLSSLLAFASTVLFIWSLANIRGGSVYVVVLVVSIVTLMIATGSVVVGSMAARRSSGQAGRFS